MAQINISKFDGVLENENYIVFHYACSDLESFPVEISSIGCYDAEQNSEQKFSRNEQTERELILDFLNFVKERIEEGYAIIGWNINKEIFGLRPILRRYRILTGKEFDLEPSNLEIYDLDEIIKDQYDFEGGLHNLALFNSITMKMFVFGKDELRHFQNKNFQKLDNSVLRKVRIIKQILQLYEEDKLLIKPKNIFFQIYAWLYVSTRKIRTFVDENRKEIIIAFVISLAVSLLINLI